MDVTLHVEVDPVLDHQRLECLLVSQTDIRRVVLGGDVPRPVETDDHPGRLFAIDRSEIVLEPLVLLIRVSKGTVVRTGIGAASFVRRLETGGEISFAIEYDKVGKAIVEGVPEVAEATGFIRGHAEVVNWGIERVSPVRRGNGVVELTVTGKVELTWNTYRGGVSDIVDSIRGPTRDAPGLVLGQLHVCEAYPLSQLAYWGVHGEYKDE